MAMKTFASTQEYRSDFSLQFFRAVCIPRTERVSILEARKKKGKRFFKTIEFVYYCELIVCVQMRRQASGQEARQDHTERLQLISGTT